MPRGRPGGGPAQGRERGSVLDRVAEMLSAASHPTRIAMLRVLSRSPRTYSQLARALGMDLATEASLFSFHTKKLAAAGLAEKEGRVWTITKQGRVLVSAGEALAEREEEEEMMGLVIEEAARKHIPGIKQFFEDEYGVDQEWLASIEKTYVFLLSGRRFVSEDSEALSLVAAMDEKIVGFIGGRLVGVGRPTLVPTLAFESDERFSEYVKKSFPDLDSLAKMSKEEREKVEAEFLAKAIQVIGVDEEEWGALEERWADVKEAWIDMLWSVEHNERFVKKRLVSGFIDKAREKGAWTIQALLPNPYDVVIVEEMGFGKMDGQLCASFVGPRDLLKRLKVAYELRLGSSMMHWLFSEDEQRSRIRPVDRVGEIGYHLDTTQFKTERQAER